MTPDPLTVTCPHCLAQAGDRCCTYKDALAGRPHKQRVSLAFAVAAHADPALGAFFPPIGPCGICGVPGMPQRHRVVDAIAGGLEAGEGDEDVAVDYGLPMAAMEAVRAWMARWPGAWG